MHLEFTCPFEGTLSEVRAERNRILDGYPNIRRCIFFPTEGKDTGYMKGYFDILIA